MGDEVITLITALAATQNGVVSLAQVRSLGGTRPATQVVHRRGAQTFARVDFLFADHGAVVEVSGRLGHASDAERARDAQRRNELQAVGRRVFEFTTRQVFDRPGEVGDFLIRELVGPASASANGRDVAPDRGHGAPGDPQHSGGVGVTTPTAGHRGR